MEEMRSLLLFLLLTSLLAGEDTGPKKLELSEKEITTDWGEKNPCGIDTPLTLREALRYTLQYQQKIKMSIEDVRFQEGVVQQHAAPFDALAEVDVTLVDTENAQGVFFTTHDPGYNNTLQIAESKKFRIGTQLAVKAAIQQVDDPSLVPPPITPASRNIPLYNSSTITFNITQPLLKGFLCGLDAMQERASFYELRAIYYDSLFSISKDVLDTINAYWDVVSAQQELEVRKKSVERFELLVRKTKRLVDESQIAASDIDQPLANLASERVNYYNVQQALYAAMQNLKLTTGLVEISCISKDLFKAVDDFPDLLDQGNLCSMMDLFVQFGIQFRLDLKASLMRECEFKNLLEGSKNEMKPRLDVIGEYSIVDFKRGSSSRKFFNSLDYRIPERNYTVGVVVSRPICNSEAKGLYRENLAQLRKTRYGIVELKQTIMTTIMSVWMGHFRFLKEIGDAKKAIEYFDKLVIDEGKRLDAGVGSLFNLIQYQNNLTSAQATLISVRHDYAQNLANLHFQTGLLLEPDSNLCAFAVQDVMRLPELK